MAFETKGTKIMMDAYDYGLQLPFEISEIDFESNDKILFELKKDKNSGVIVSKEYSNQSTTDGLVRVFLEFTKKESEGLHPGNYVYYLKHIREDQVRDTLVLGEDFQIRNG